MLSAERGWDFVGPCTVTLSPGTNRACYINPQPMGDGGFRVILGRVASGNSVIVELVPAMDGSFTVAAVSTPSANP